MRFSLQEGERERALLSGGLEWWSGVWIGKSKVDAAVRACSSELGARTNRALLGNIKRRPNTPQHARRHNPCSPSSQYSSEYKRTGRSFSPGRPGQRHHTQQKSGPLQTEPSPARPLIFLFYPPPLAPGRCAEAAQGVLARPSTRIQARTPELCLPPLVASFVAPVASIAGEKNGVDQRGRRAAGNQPRGSATTTFHATVVC
jgi:hypothetical protein